tara:strand:- start:13716 stop:14552 length:837 start_codon:yes stop_codon:yes gene_type:complete
VKKYFDLLRVNHWLKNLYIFIPIFFNKDLSLLNLIHLFKIFLLFCFSASIIYIINDLIDYKLDKKNPWKKNRPIASDLFSKKNAILIALLLFIILLFLAFVFQTSRFVIFLICSYLLINIVYSLVLKKIFILNYFVLLSFFYIRLIAGTIDNEIQLSNWLTIFILTSSGILIIGKKISDYDYSYKENYNKKVLLNLLNLITISQLVIYIIFVNTEYAIMKYGNEFKYSIFFVILGTIRYLFLIRKNIVTSDQIKLFTNDKILITTCFSYLIYLFLIFY